MGRLVLVLLIAPSITFFAKAFVPITGQRFASGRTCCRDALESRAITPLFMAIRSVETYNGDFMLEEETAKTLDKYLRHPDMIAEVCKQFDCEEAEYTGDLFQPVPYSTGTPRGMPAEIEEKYFLKLEYAIANIPPVVMFNAKIFKPSRLCAVYRVGGLSEAAEEAVRERIQSVRFRLPHVALFVHTYDVILRGMIQYLEGKRTPQGSLATDNESRKKEESERIDAWDDIGSTIREVFDTFDEDGDGDGDGDGDDEGDDVDLDSMVV